MATPKIKPLVYPHEHIEWQEGLAMINATNPPFEITWVHLDRWFKAGVIGRYFILNDVREMWSLAGRSMAFRTLFSEAIERNATLLGFRGDQARWESTVKGDVFTFGIFALDAVESLYGEAAEDITRPVARNVVANRGPTIGNATIVTGFPAPVLPRHDAEKIYRMVHGLDEPKTKQPAERTTDRQARVIVELLRHADFTDEDFNGSIPAFVKKVSRKIPALSGHGEDAWSGWLRRGGGRTV